MVSAMNKIKVLHVIQGPILERQLRLNLIRVALNPHAVKNPCTAFDFPKT